MDGASGYGADGVCVCVCVCVRGGGMGAVLRVRVPVYVLALWCTVHIKCVRMHTRMCICACTLHTACRAHWHAPAHRPQPMRQDTHAHAHQHAATPLPLSNMHASKHILADRPVLSHIRQRLVEGQAFSFHQVGTDAAHAAADLIHISCIGMLHVRVRAPTRPASQLTPAQQCTSTPPLFRALAMKSDVSWKN